MGTTIEQARAAGYSDAEINAYLAPRMAEAQSAGYSQDEINKHLGITAPPPFDGGRISQHGEQNLAASPKPVTSFSDALTAGWQLSTTGLVTRGAMPNKQVAADAPMASRIAGQVATLAGDVPAMVAGYGIAQAGGEAGGPAGAVLGTGAAMALPTVLRQTLMDSYQHGQFQNFSDFWSRASGIMIDTAKSWVTGAATGGAGAAVKAAAPVAAEVAPWLASPAMTAGTKTAAEIATMTTVGAALEGHVPSARDFLDAAVLIGGLKFAEVGASKLRAIYAQKGIAPRAVLADAANDITVHQDLLSSDKMIPSLYELPEGMSESEASGRMLAAGREANRSATTAEPGAGETAPGEGSSRVSALEPIPPEPQRLIPFLQGGVAINPGTPAERMAQFGVTDPGGDIAAIVGGPKGRPGLINNTAGERLDDAGLRAYQAGYFNHRPDLNELRAAIEEDHNGNPIYSSRDQAAVEAHQQAIASNDEITRLASQWGVSERGKTRAQFFDALADHLSQEQIAGEMDRLEPDHADAYAEFERAMGDAGAAMPESGRSLEDLEREYQQEEAARTASGRDSGSAQPGTARPGTGAGEGGGGQIERAAGDGGRAGEAAGGVVERERPGGIDGELPLSGGGRPPPPTPPIQESLPLPSGDRPVRTLAEAQAAILDHVSVGEKPASRGWSFARLYTDTIDRLYPIWTAADEARAKLGIDEMPATLDPGKLSRLYAGAPGVAQRFLNHDTIDFRTREVNGPGLKTILAPVAGDLDGFRAYISARHSLDLEANDVKTGFNLDAARMVVEAGRDRYGPIQQALTDYSNRAAAYARDAGVISKAGYDAMVEKRAFYVPFQRVMEADLASGNGGGGMGKTLQAKNPVRGIEGSEREVIDPIESVIRNTFLMTQMAERNNVGIALVDLMTRAAGKEIVETPSRSTALHGKLTELLEKAGITDPEAVKGLSGIADMSSPVADGQIRVLRDGSPQTFDVDPELARSFKALDQDTANWLIRALAVPARMLRAGATLTPDFMVRNLLRDFTTAFINTGKGAFSPIDTMRGLAGVIREDNDYQRWISEGGASASMVSLDREYLQESLAKLTAETGLGTRAWNVVRHPIETLRMVSELTEQATRLGEFKGVYGKLMAEGKSPVEAGREAAYSSREVTLDFARMGAKMKSTNMIIAFFNAQLQGVDRLVRAGIEAPVSTSAKILAGVTIPSILLWYANKDDQRVQDLPNWQKDLFWIIATDKWENTTPDKVAGLPAYMTRTVDGQTQINNGHLFRIPKPFETGILFGSGVERILDAWVAHKPNAFKGLADSIAGGLLPSFTPTFALPLLEQFANRSTFTGRTLVPDQMEKQLPEYQYTPYTTETAKAIGQIIGAFPGIGGQRTEDGTMGAVARSLSSPILMENYLRAWTGNLGTYALAAADKGLRSAGVLPDPVKPDDTLADIPFVRAFAVRYPSASAQSIQDFNDDFKKTKVFFDTWVAKAKEGDPDALARIRALSPPIAQQGMNATNASLYGVGKTPPNQDPLTAAGLGSALMRKTVPPGQMMDIAGVRADAVIQRADHSTTPVTIGQLNDVHTSIALFSQIVRDVYKNPEISSGEKRQLIDTAYWRMESLARAGNRTIARAQEVLGAPH